ncbi:phosphatidylserine decarboxylase family protein [Desulfosediminicola flagellatus]|uniref:phosphatidylserine decarboxylase family protein n=1 Tax=Desulfosediminicola flagellatus TaxID=2569541 RepID=UPI0010ACC9BD|nr:phosphatidylserine decarboxylase family protein [Desulfosediminicola flagellatus]
MLKPQIPVAKEGFPFIGFMVFITLVFAILSYDLLVWPCLVLTVFVLCFFRDPERFVPPEEDAMVSPADGKVIIAEKVQDDTFTEGEAFKVSIFMNVFNVHVNRAPMAGTVEKIVYRPGKFYAADSARGALQNEYCGTVLQTASGKKIAFVQIAGLIARRIICWLEPGDSILKGRRFGLIRFGSRVDLYLPLDTEILVQVGQKVRAGETVIANLK